MKTISIAMTTYNGTKYLREQLESIYSQTRLPDEVIAVDDGSIDGTLDLLKEFHEKKGLRFYINETRLGINLNFNRAISLCKGDYIAICDQDDVWFPEKLHELIEKMQEVENNEPTLVVADLILANERLEPLRDYHSKLFPDSIAFSILGNARQGCCMFLNRALVNLALPIPDSGYLHNNYDYYLSIVGTMCGGKHYLNKPLMYYRVHGGNAVGNTLSQRPNVLTKWGRSVTQSAYELSILDQFEPLKEILRIHGGQFRVDRTQIYLEMMTICRKDRTIESWRTFIQTSALSKREKLAAVASTLLLHCLLRIRNIRKWISK